MSIWLGVLGLHLSGWAARSAGTAADAETFLKWLVIAVFEFATGLYGIGVFA